MQAFQRFLGQYLLDRHWTYADLGRATGIDSSGIGRWFGAKPKRPSPANLERLAPTVGVSVEELMRLCGYLPGDVAEFTSDPGLAEIKSRTDRLAELLTPYPRAMWSTLMDVFEQMATLPQAVTTPTPPGNPAVAPVRHPRPHGIPTGESDAGEGVIVQDYPHSPPRRAIARTHVPTVTCILDPPVIPVHAYATGT